MGARPMGEFDPQLADLIKHKVRKLIGHYGFTRSDRDDLEQELSMHLIRGMRKHDPTRSSAGTYADCIVTRKIASIIEHRTAQRRDRNRERPLDHLPESVLADPTQSPQRLELVQDVHNAIAGLPEDLRPIATLLVERSEAEVIRLTGLGRQRIRGMRQRIARHLEAMGLGEQRKKNNRQPFRGRTR